MDPVQTMPAFDQLTKEIYTPKQWLNYYRNIWHRNTVARTIDVLTDTELKKKNPDENVQCEDGQVRPVKQRLELRKEAVQDGLNLVKTIDAMIAVADDKFTETFWSEAALAVAEDMKPKPVEATSPATPEGDKPEARGAVDEGQAPAKA